MIEKDSRSKELAYLLRHDSEGYKLGKIDSHGWRKVKELCEDYKYTIFELEDLVETDSKGRYEFSEDKTLIRARQGHSIDVMVDSISEATPPPILYHGTSEKYLESIMSQGLIPKTRLYVHLSADIETAKKVGSRHSGKTIILAVNSADMKNDGIVFKVSGNGVWLVPEVKPKYLEIYEAN